MRTRHGRREYRNVANGTGSRRLLATAILVLVAVLGAAGWHMALSPPGEREAGLYWRSMGARRLAERDFVAQRGWTDCGAAALAELLSAMGWERGADTVRAAVVETESGATVGELRRVAAHFGLDLGAVRPESDAWAHTEAPYLVLLDRRHYVTLLEQGPDSVTLADPAAGVFRVPVSRFRSMRPRALLRVSGEVVGRWTGAPRG